MGPATSGEYEARAEYDVTSSILGKAPAPIHCHVFAESPFWLGLAYSTAQRYYNALLPFFQETSTVFYGTRSHNELTI